MDQPAHHPDQLLEADSSSAHAIVRTVWLYPWYALTFNAYFWMPVFVLYFLRHMPLADVLRLEAIYYLGVVLLEVPSGCFSDRIGRKPTLLLACGFLVAACALFAIGSSFGVFAVAQVLLATGLAFDENSVLRDGSPLIAGLHMASRCCSARLWPARASASATASATRGSFRPAPFSRPSSSRPSGSSCTRSCSYAAFRGPSRRRDQSLRLSPRAQ